MYLVFVCVKVRKRSKCLATTANPVLARKLGYKARINGWEKCLLAVLTVKLRQHSGKIRQQLSDSLLLFKPETVLGWHKALVQPNWTFKQPSRVGRPPTAKELCDLVIRLARENDWGYDKIKGELLKLGYRLDRTTVKNILKRAGIVPAPERGRSLNQRHLGNVLAQYSAYYNPARPHQGPGKHTPLPLIVSPKGRVCCRDVLCGFIHDYYRQAA